MKKQPIPTLRGRGPVDAVRFAWHLPNFVRLFWRLFQDARVGTLPKALLVGALVYVLSPVDFLSDMLPLLGIVDDLALVMLASRLFIRLCPKAVVDEHLARLGG